MNSGKLNFLFDVVVVIPLISPIFKKVDRTSPSKLATMNSANSSSSNWLCSRSRPVAAAAVARWFADRNVTSAPPSSFAAFFYWSLFRV